VIIVLHKHLHVFKGLSYLKKSKPDPPSPISAHSTFILFIKGYEFNTSKIAELFSDLKVNVAIRCIVRDKLNRDGFLYVACGSQPDKGVTYTLVIVLDQDNDLEALKKRDLGEIDPSILGALVVQVLEGPDVWERSA
jgi:hypothetical protein